MSGATGMTFTSLKQSLTDYIENGVNNAAFVRQLPQIINQAERSLADRLKIQGYRDVLTGALTAQSPVLAKPDGWRNTVTFVIGTLTNYNTRKILRARSFELLDMIAPEQTAYDTPSWYTDYSFGFWKLAPTPDVAYPFEVTVYRLPDLLSDSNQQNYLTQFTPNLLLFECLTNMEPFLRNDSRMLMWKEMRDEELSAIGSQEIQKLVDRDQSRTSV